MDDLYIPGKSFTVDEKFLPTQKNQYCFLPYEMCPLINRKKFQINRTWTLLHTEKCYFKFVLVSSKEPQEI